MQIKSGNLSLLVALGGFASQIEWPIVNNLEALLNVSPGFTPNVLNHFKFNTGTAEQELAAACVDKIDIHLALVVWIAFHHRPRVEVLRMFTVEHITSKV